MQPPSKSNEYIESDKPGSLKAKAPLGFCGQSMDWYTDTPPAGWLILDGSLVNKDDYPDLWALLGNTWGTSTTTQFYLPDMRGRVAVGKDAGQVEFAAIAQAGGHKLMQSHVHGQQGWATGVGSGSAGWSGIGTGSFNATNTLSAGGGNAENMPPYKIVHKIMKT